MPRDATDPTNAPETDSGQGRCLFCRIASGAAPAAIVCETEHTLAFLDHAPVFPGHTLVVPKVHVETLTDLDPMLIGPVFGDVQRIGRAVEAALDAHGTWVSMNNRVSQSVLHLHIHVIPRRRKDGLKGFYWPRMKYPSTEVMQQTATLIASRFV